MSEQPLTLDRCPLCGGLNHCAMAQDSAEPSDCWCSHAAIDPEALAHIPAELQHKVCLCPRCAQRATEQ